MGHHKYDNVAFYSSSKDSLASLLLMLCYTAQRVSQGGQAYCCDARSAAAVMQDKSHHPTLHTPGHLSVLPGLWVLHHTDMYMYTKVCWSVGPTLYRHVHTKV